MKNGGKLLFMLLIIFINSTAFAGNTERADELKNLGLFLGTENGYELDAPFTREQGATMVVRLMGAEKTALAGEYKEVFSDVLKDKWSHPYVMYCYDNGITKGTSETTFTPETEMTAEEYVTFILRLLGYTDVAPETAFEYAVEKELLNSETVSFLEKQDKFLRGEMVYISYNALKTKTTTGEILAYKLVKQNVITQKEAEVFDITKADNINEMVDMFLE